MLDLTNLLKWKKLDAPSDTERFFRITMCKLQCSCQWCLAHQSQHEKGSVRHQLAWKVALVLEQMYGSYYVELFAVQGSEQYYQTPGIWEDVKNVFLLSPKYMGARKRGRGGNRKQLSLLRF